MTITGTVRGKTVELDQEPAIPDGTRVVVDLEPSREDADEPISLGEWLDRAAAFRKTLPTTEDSVEILRRIREERASR